MDSAKGDEGDAVDVAELLSAVLLPEEWLALQQKFIQKKDAPELSVQAWSDFGKTCLNLLLGCTSTKWRWPAELLTVAAKQVGCTNRPRVETLFGFKPSRSMWRIADVDGACLQNHDRSHNNGRTGFRKLSHSVIEQILTDNSSETCKFGVPLGRSKEGVSKEPFPIKALSSTPSAIHRSTDELVKSVDPRTFRRYVKKDFPQYRVTTWKLDCCEKCLSWDTRVLALMKKTLLDVVDPIVKIWPSYFKKWEEEWADPRSPEFEVTSSSIFALT